MITGTKEDFPLMRLAQANGKPLAYLDNAATTQKPDSVLSAVDRYLAGVANPHRGAYQLSSEATQAYEGARERVAGFIGAPSADTVVFTRNATGALNLIASSYGTAQVNAGDTIVVSVAEHHSNLLPWQRLAQQVGAKLEYLYLDATGAVSLEEAVEKITPETKIVAITHISNVLGIENPVADIVEIAHRQGAVVVVDGAQSVPHIPVDVQKLDVDFLVFSGHKMFAPDGSGVLYAKAELLADMAPYEVGGGIVEEVTEQTVRYMDPPARFEAGTPNVEAAVGLHAAIDYYEEVGFDTIVARERSLTTYLTDAMTEIPGLVLYGNASAAKKHGVAAFNVGDVHPHDVATILDSHGVAVRAGHHCAQPLLRYLGIRSCCRASLTFINTEEDIDRLQEALTEVARWL